VALRAVVFDFDGVIANSEPLHFRAMRDVLIAEGLSLTESDYYSKYLGFDDIGAFGAIAADRGLNWPERQIRRMVAKKAELLERLETGSSVLFPGAAEAIRRLSSAGPLAVASGAIRPEIDRVLAREGLSSCFMAIVAAGDTLASKPAPDPYLRAVALLSECLATDIEPEECVAIEDSLWGLASARSAGLRTVAVTHTYAANALEGADAVIGHLGVLTWEFLGTVIRNR